jgi:hypothetical protein
MSPVFMPAPMCDQCGQWTTLRRVAEGRGDHAAAERYRELILDHGAGGHAGPSPRVPSSST